MKDSDIMVSLPVAVVRLLPMRDVTLGEPYMSRRTAGVMGNVASYIPQPGGNGLWFVRHDDGVTAPYSARELVRVMSWLEVRPGRDVCVVLLRKEACERASWHEDASNRRRDARGTIVGWITDKLVLVRHESGENAPYHYQELAPDEHLDGSAHREKRCGKSRKTKK